MNKKILLITIISLSVIAIAIGLISLLKNGNWYVGDAWCKTPEEALLKEADMDLDRKRVLSIKQLLDKQEIDDITIMIFVSQDDTLTEVSFVTNKDGLYCVSGYTEEVLLDSPSEFVVTGDKDQFILFPYHIHNSTVYGWCYPTVIPVVNGSTPEVKSYEFECQGKKRTLNYWRISDISDTENVGIDFVRQ